MAHLSGTNRSQLLLLPEAVDHVGPDNPLRFIEAFVDDPDLAAAGFVRVAAKETGRPGSDPADMLKLYIYGYLNRVRSSRRLEADAHRNIEAILLLRHLKPDFRTIAAFRRMNRLAILAALAATVIGIGFAVWPADNPEVVEHSHDELPADHPHLAETGDAHRHAHAYVIDDMHPAWPGGR